MGSDPAGSSGTAVQTGHSVADTGVQKNGTELTEPQQPAELMSKYDQANADAVLIGSNTPDPRATAELCEGWTADYAPVLRRLPVKAVSDCARLVPQIFKRIKNKTRRKTDEKNQNTYCDYY